MNAIAITVDEFGRDISLRKQNKENEQSVRNKYKGMKWSDICDEIEEEIERISLEVQQKQNALNLKKFKKITDERKELLRKGIYELEEGEILE